MIKPSEKKKITAVLGGHYTGKVIKHLDKKKIVNRDGKSFSATSIRNIMTGTENLIVEAAIISLVAKEKKKIEKDNVRRKNQLR